MIPACAIATHNIVHGSHAPVRRGKPMAIALSISATRMNRGQSARDSINSSALPQMFKTNISG